jgi:glycosyltransferase involved in cell wall biosynthesis
LKTTIKRAATVVVTSKTEFDEALQYGVDRNKLHIIPPGIDIEHPTLEATSSRSTLHLLYTGPLLPDRRLELILRAARNLTVPFIIDLVEWGPAVPGVTDYLHTLQKLSKVLGLDDRVAVHRAATGDEVKRFYRNADVFVYPVGHEPLGQPLLEAAAHGLPIITTPVGVALDLVISGETGFVVPADPDTIGDRIMQLNSPDLRQKFRRRILDHVRDQFSWTHITQRYLHLYQSLLR